jgi:exosortase
MERLIAIVSTRSPLRRFWALSLALGFAVVAMAVGTTAGLNGLWERWTDYPYDHALVIVAMSVWLAIDAVRNNTIEKIHPSFIGGAALVLVLTVYGACELAGSALGMQATLPVMLLALTATIAGLNAALRLAFPILFLYFAVPVWDLAIMPLQQTTTAAVSTALHWTGFAAFIEGNLIHIPAGTFQIAEGCAGLRYFIVSFALATFYSVLYLRTWAMGLTLTVVALATAILCNWLRVYSLVVIGDITEMQHYLIAVSHSRFGWFVYGISLIPVFVVAVRLERRTEAVNAPASSRIIEISSPSRYLTTAVLASALLVAPSLMRL